jgi:hypothetical protein
MASCSPSFSTTGWTCPVNAPKLLSAGTFRSYAVTEEVATRMQGKLP